MSLRLNKNALYGTIPYGISRLNLFYLNLQENELQVLPSDLFELNDLTHLFIDRNSFTGTISSNGNLSMLEVFWMHTNFFSGTIPNWIFTDTKLSTFWASINLLTGRLPNDFSGMIGISECKLFVLYFVFMLSHIDPNC